MIIRGILDNSLNGQLCIRGFAPIKELERISKADYDYQRNPLEEHEAEILDFLDNEPYLFFPEIILSYKIKHDFSKAKDSETPILKIQSRKSYTSNVDKTKIIVKSHDYKTFDAAGKNTLTVVEITFNETKLSEALSKGEFPFHRIDGNHRLSAAKSSETSKVARMVAPFCILLGQEFYTKGKLTTDSTTETFDKSVKVFFHNINTKTTPLSSEENKKVIIDDKINFPPEELESILGMEGLKTRELIEKVNPAIFTGIDYILSKQYRTYYIEVFKKLLDKGENPDEIVGKVFESLKAVDHLYKDNDKLKANSSFGLLTAFLYYHVENNKAKYNYFKDWVLKNHIFEIPEIRAESIIKIFDKIAEKNIKIFVAMPYFGKDQVKSYNNTYEKVINEIKEEYPHLNIEQPISIMQHEGKTFDLLANLLNSIKECSIFVADLSAININVIYELGYARSLDKPTILVCREKDFDKIPFDIEHDSRRSYKPLAHNTLEDVLKKDIIGILTKDYGYIIPNEK